MDKTLVESPEKRGEAYRQRAEAAVASALHARSDDIAASYCRLADIWGKLAATVEPLQATKHDAR